MNTKSFGFTLIEFLVAVGIFSLIATMGYSGLSQVIKTQKAQTRAQLKIKDIERALLVMARDFYQIVPRSVRNNQGNLIATLVFDDNSNFIEFTKLNSAIPYFSEEEAQFRRSRLTRVGYKLEGSDFYREHYNTLDRTLGTVPSKTLMLKDVLDFSVRFLNADRTWSKFWLTSKTDLEQLPVAIEIKLTIHGGNEYTHLFPVLEPPTAPKTSS